MKRAFLFIFILTTFVTACGGTNFTPNASSTPIPSTSPPEPAPDEVELDLPDYTGLTFADFLEASYLDLILRTPELYTEMGLETIYGIEPLRLNNISSTYIQETSLVYEHVLAALQDYTIADLTEDQQLSYRIYAEFLDKYLANAPFIQHDYLETGYFLVSQTAATEFFFTDSHPFNKVTDIENYLVRLALVDEKLALLASELEARTALGLMPPQFMVNNAINQVAGVANSFEKSTPYYLALGNGIRQIDGISTAESDSYLIEAAKIISTEILPAYSVVKDALETAKNNAPQQIGVGTLPQGEEFYNSLLAYYTTTDLTADEIHQLGLTELERIHAEMRAEFAKLGYPADISIEQAYQRMEADDASFTGPAIKAEYERIIEEASQRIPELFIDIPEQEVIVIGGDTGGYYLPASLDGTRPGAFYAATVGSNSYATMPTLSYHEAIPGHHLQIALAQQLDLPTFRRTETFTAYVEGWALYAERLAFEAGWYADDPYGNLGRLQFEAFRAARLVVDTGIHAYGWNFSQATGFFVENTGFPQRMAEGQIYRYTALPGQATAYMIGMLQILELRAQAQTALGEQFELAEFHQVVLGNGALPLSILEQVVTDYIDDKLAGK